MNEQTKFGFVKFNYCAFKLRVHDQSQLDSSGRDTSSFDSIPLESSSDWSGTWSLNAHFDAPHDAPPLPSVDTPLSYNI